MSAAFARPRGLWLFHLCVALLYVISPASLGALGERKQLGVLPHTWRSSADLEGMDE